MKHFVLKLPLLTTISSALAKAFFVPSIAAKIFSLPFIFAIALLFLNISILKAQIYDVLITEPFDNTDDITTNASSFNGSTSGTCGNNNLFNVTAVSGPLTCFRYEVGSVFMCIDKDAASVGSTNPLYIELLEYTVTDNDEVGFVGNFAAISDGDTESTDVVTVAYSTNGGSSYTDALVLTGNGTADLNYTVNGESFSCDDGSANVHADFENKEFSIGSGLSGSVIKIKVTFEGFTHGTDGVALDEFRLVKVREILASEDFDNTTSLTASSGVFATPIEGCGSNSIFDVTANMTDATDASSCVGGEDGSFFVNTRRPAGVAYAEELEMLTYTVATNSEISFRGNFSTFGGDQDPDNHVVISYSTDNGGSYIDALTINGIGTGTDFHSVADGSATIGQSFIKKGFVIGSNLSGDIIKIKATYQDYSGNGDGIALDKFRLEGSLVVALPIELLDFSAKLVGDDVALEWVTASEINNDYFTIQRSLDAVNFEGIAQVPGAGNSNNILSYGELDYEVDFNGIVYYRLKQTDFDGATSYSEIRPVDLSGLIQNSWSIYPNPANQMLHVSGAIEGLEVMNIIGEKVQIKQNGQTAIDLTRFANGTYFIKVWFENGNVDVKKFVVNH